MVKNQCPAPNAIKIKLKTIKHQKLKMLHLFFKMKLILIIPVRACA